MKQKMKIFNVVFGVLICLAPVGARAAGDFECGYFNPAFGLCSTHSHNIGAMDDKTNLPVNPTKSEETAQMNDVIALKSTVIAQQLKEQYDALNAVIKRFKTQLEKAVLTSKIEVITGNTASGNSGGGASASGSYNNNGLANAEDCDNVLDMANVYDCLNRNLTKISQAVDNDLSGARKQLKNDIKVMDGYKVCGDSTSDCISDASCKSIDGSKNNIKECVKALQRRLKVAKNDFDRKNAQARYGRQKTAA